MVDPDKAFTQWHLILFSSGAHDLNLGLGLLNWAGAANLSSIACKN